MYEKSHIIFGTSYCPETYRDSYQIPLGFVQVFADSNLSCKQFCLLHAFCHLQIFFQNQFFQKILSGIQSDCQKVWIKLRFNVLVGLT